MNPNQYTALLASFTIAKARFNSYLSDTPNTVVQGDRGALKDSFRQLEAFIKEIDVPEGVDVDEIVSEALATLVVKPEVPNKTAYEDVYDKQGNLVSSEEVDLTEEVNESLDNDIQDENDVKAEETDPDEKLEGQGDAFENALEEQGQTIKDAPANGEPEIKDDPDMFGAYKKADLKEIAKECYAENRKYCIELEEDPLPAEEAPEEIIESVMRGIENLILNPETTPQSSHRAWVKHKIDNGWVYGEVKDFEKKTHPCIVDYDKLPPESQHKDEIFLTTARAGLDKLNNGGA